MQIFSRAQLVVPCYVLLLALLGSSAIAQTTTPLINSNLQGKVVDAATSETLIGATIEIEGTTHKAVTDETGSFRFITGQKFPYTLIVSYIGYKPSKLVVNGSPITIKLQADQNQLEDVVVVGYGTVKKSDITGSVVSLKPENISQGVNASVDQIMQGRAAGVQINQTSSEPGGGVSVRIRGTSSINAGNEPLYVIDGFPVDNGSLLSPTGSNTGIGSNANPRNPLNSINPTDIENIEILKDASAVAIYGSRGANGVILITTKKGSNKGRVSVALDSYLGTQSVTNRVEVLSAPEYISYMNDIAALSGSQPDFTADDISRIGNGTNWQDQIYQSAHVNNNNLSLSGGDEKTRFYSSLNYFDQNGVVKNSGIKKYIARLNLDRKTGTKGLVGISINTSLLDDRNSIDGLNVNENAGPINAALLYDPTEPLFNADGTFARSTNLTINNPLSLIEGISSKNRTNRTIGNIFYKYNFTDHLDAKIQLGSDRESARRDLYNSTKTIAGASAKGIANIATQERINNLLEYTMHYNNALNSWSVIDLTGGISYQDFNLKTFEGTGRNFPSDDLGTDNLGLADPANYRLGSGQESYRLLSYLGRVNYAILDKYLFTATFRADGSSRFGENNKFGYFPSLAFAWKLDKEPFVPEFFEDLKLRTSWGITGNQDIANYASLSTYSTGSTAVLGNSVYTGVSPRRMANPDLKWETTEQYNVGIDASFAKGRIQLTADVFLKNTRDMLVNKPLPSATGYPSVLTNLGKMQNKGFELALNTTNIKHKDFTWSTNLNFSAIRNKVTDLGGVSEIRTGNVENIGNTVIVREGLPAYSYFGYIVDGIYSTAEEIAASAQPASKPGFPAFRDINGDKTISPADQVVIGDPYPDFFYGFQNTLSFKNFQLDFFIQGQQGGDLLNINVLEGMYPTNARRNNIAEIALNRWTPENTSAKWPSGANSTSYGGGKVNSLVLQDASFLRLKNVQLSHRFKISHRSVESLRVYVSAQNLFTLTDYIGFNPESNSFGRSNVRLDYNAYPVAKIWTLGFNVALK